MISSLWKSSMTITRVTMPNGIVLYGTDGRPAPVDNLDPASPHSTTFAMMCSHQPATEDQMKMFPEGRKTNFNRVSFSGVECQLADENIGLIADTTTFDGHNLVAVWVKKWGEGNLAHFETGWAADE